MPNYNTTRKPCLQVDEPSLIGERNGLWKFPNGGGPLSGEHDTGSLDNIAEYEPGAFYKRELPCILSLLQQIAIDEVEVIIADGSVWIPTKQRLISGI